MGDKKATDVKLVNKLSKLPDRFARMGRLTVQSRIRKAIIVGVAFLVYAILYIPAYRLFGSSAAILALLPMTVS